MGRTRATVTLYFGFGWNFLLRRGAQQDAHSFAEELASLALTEAAGAYCADRVHIDVVDVQIYSGLSNDFPVYRSSRRVSREELRYWRPRDPDYIMRATFYATMVKPGIAVYSDGREQVYTADEWRDEFASEVGLLFQDICLAIALARFGTIATSNAVILGRYRRTSERVRLESDGLLRYADQRGWPSIKILPLQQVVDWLTKYRLARQIGNAPVGRAVNALLNLDASDGSYAGSAAHLFWAMLGLEALYARGTEKIQQQLDDKVQVFLGPRVSFKKDLKEMYAIRSRFVHGDLAFPSIYYPYDATTEFDEFAGTVYAAADQAEAILLSTLQELITRNWNTLEFATSLRLITPTALLENE
jgi:hypothetical protein